MYHVVRQTQKIGHNLLWIVMKSDVGVQCATYTKFILKTVFLIAR